MTEAEAPRWILMFVVLPLTIAAGLVDWFCHRRTWIEDTSGLKENLFHWALFAVMGVAIAAVALLEITAGVMLLVAAAWALHQGMTFAELKYTVPLRSVRPFEQMVHSFMELLPLMVLVLLAVMRWDQVVALFGAGAADFGLRPKAQPWPVDYLAAAFTAVLVCNLLPLADETLRCLRRPLP